MKRLNQSGAVAILTVVIFSLIVTIVVTAYARITVVEHQESINFDLSTRAYYAAEAGVQDAIRDIRQADPAVFDSLRNKGRPDECKPVGAPADFGELGGSSNLGYTCQLIDVTPKEVVAVANTNPTLFELTPNQTINSTDPKLQIEVAWSESGNGGTNLVPRDSSNKFFPKTTDWNINGNKIHPVLRLTAIRLLGKPTGRNKFTQNTFFLNPTKTADADTASTLNFGPSKQEPKSVTQNSSCVETNATPILDGYSCKWLINLNASDLANTQPAPDNVTNRIFLSFTSEYGATNFMFKLLKDGNNIVGDQDVIEVKDSQANIDVTARAGNVFRRVQQRIPLNNSYSQNDFRADALVVGKGICKHFKITDKPPDFSGCVTTPPTP